MLSSLYDPSSEARQNRSRYETQLFLSDSRFSFVNMSSMRLGYQAWRSTTERFFLTVSQGIAPNIAKISSCRVYSQCSMLESLDPSLTPSGATESRVILFCCDETQSMLVSDVCASLSWTELTTELDKYALLLVGPKGNRDGDSSMRIWWPDCRGAIVQDKEFAE
jgi:hypothetical protein